MEMTIRPNPPTAEGAPVTRDFDLGQWLGRREAFGLVAGRCSAAEVECLRRIRDEKLYLDRVANWDDFCSKYLGASRRTIDNNIRQLKEFGPSFFHLAQLTRITPETYRAIAPQVSAEGVTLGGEVIALAPENSRKLAEAVAALSRQTQPKPASTSLSYATILKRCKSVTAWLEARTLRLNPDQQFELAAVLRRLDAAADRVGATVFDVQQ
jgi:hypothetical protein